MHAKAARNVTESREWAVNRDKPVNYDEVLTGEKEKWERTETGWGMNLNQMKNIIFHDRCY